MDGMGEDEMNEKLATYAIRDGQRTLVGKTCSNPECRNSGKVLPVSDFNRHSKRADGLQSWCRECQQEDLRKRQEQQPPTQPTVTVTDPFERQAQALERIAAALETMLAAGVPVEKVP